MKQIFLNFFEQGGKLETDGLEKTEVDVQPFKETVETMENGVRIVTLERMEKSLSPVCYMDTEETIPKDDFDKELKEAFTSENYVALTQCIRGYCEENAIIIRGVCFNLEGDGIEDDILYLNTEEYLKDEDGFAAYVRCQIGKFK